MPRGVNQKTPENVERVVALRAEGKLLREIAAEIGVGLKTVHTWLDDPDGAKLRERKRRYEGVCINCGGPTSGLSGGTEKMPVRCAGCAVAKRSAEREWTRDRIVAAVREWADRFGGPPSATNWNTGHPGHDAAKFAAGRWPPTTTVVREFGSWNAAIAAAGFEPRPAKAPRGPNTIPPEEIERSLALYQEHGLAAAARLLGITSNGLRRRLETHGEWTPTKRGMRMANYSAANAVERDLERTRARIAALKLELEERERYAAALEEALAALGVTREDAPKVKAVA